LEDKLLSYIQTHEADMLDLLEQLVNIDSGSHNREGNTKIARLLAELVTPLGFEVEFVSDERYGDTVVARRPGRSGKVLLLGHIDTVFPDGEASRRPFTIEDGIAMGPGVADMKAGVVNMLYAIKALDNAGWDDKSLVIIWNSHEEVGSLRSREVMKEEARDADAVFNMEPARSNGAVVTGRKGVAWANLKVNGRAAHAGVEPEKGVNALEELAHKIIAFNGLTDLSAGTTVSVGKAKGGTVTNMVPAEAEFVADMRFQAQEEAERTIARMEEIAGASILTGATCELNVDMLFETMERSEGVVKLYEQAKDIASELGFDLPEAYTGGGSDAGFTTGVGAPTLCGLGPVGGSPHSVDEYLEVDTIVPRCQLLTLLINRQ